MKVTNRKRIGIIVCLFLLCVCGYYLIIADTPMKGDGSPSDTQKIVDYRQEHGPFKSLEELRQVKGIGPALYKKIVEKVRL